MVQWGLIFANFALRKLSKQAKSLKNNAFAKMNPVLFVKKYLSAHHNVLCFGRIIESSVQGES